MNYEGMTTNEKLSCLFADLWSMFIVSVSYDTFDLQNIIGSYGFTENYMVTENDLDRFTDSDVGDEVIVLSEEGKEIMKVAKEAERLKFMKGE